MSTLVGLDVGKVLWVYVRVIQNQNTSIEVMASPGVVL